MTGSHQLDGSTDPAGGAQTPRSEHDLLARRARAEHEARQGEVGGIDLTVTFLRDKRAEAHRIQQPEPIHLGLPAVGPWNGS
jgi:hypothetical protein